MWAVAVALFCVLVSGTDMAGASDSSRTGSQQYKQVAFPGQQMDILSYLLPPGDTYEPQEQRQIPNIVSPSGNSIPQNVDSSDFASFMKALAGSRNSELQVQKVYPVPDNQQQPAGYNDIRLEISPVQNNGNTNPTAAPANDILPGAKQDRQGYYQEPVYAKEDGYGYEQQGYDKNFRFLPTIGIQIDPFRILRSLFSLIPKPLFNLNGKVFLGVELGKNVGLARGSSSPGYNQPSSGGKVFIKY